MTSPETEGPRWREGGERRKKKRESELKVGDVVLCVFSTAEGGGRKRKREP